MEGALPSVVGGLVPVPVIAVPRASATARRSAASRRCSACSTPARRASPVVNIDNGFRRRRRPRAASITREGPARGHLGRARPRRARPGRRHPAVLSANVWALVAALGGFVAATGLALGPLVRVWLADEPLTRASDFQHTLDCCAGARSAGGLGRGSTTARSRSSGARRWMARPVSAAPPSCSSPR